MSDNQGFTVNQDGSITVELDGKKVKFVKESDLGAVKHALSEKESDITKLQGNLADANTKYAEEHQTLLQERALKVELEQKAGKSATLQQQVEDLTKEMAGLKETSGSLETKYAGRLRALLSDGYKVDPEKIKDKGLADLETIEQTLSLAGYKPLPANYDGKGGISSSPDSLQGKSPLQLATLGYETSNKKKE